MFSALIWGVVVSWRSNMTRDMMKKLKIWYFKIDKFYMSFCIHKVYTANVYSQITFTLLWKLARNTKGICKCQVRQYMSKKYADLEQKLLKSKSSLLVLQVILKNHGT